MTLIGEFSVYLAVDKWNLTKIMKPIRGAIILDAISVYFEYIWFKSVCFATFEYYKYQHNYEELVN